MEKYFDIFKEKEKERGKGKGKKERKRKEENKNNMSKIISFLAENCELIIYN